MRITSLVSIFRLMASGLVLLVLMTCKKSEINTDIITDIDGNVYHTVVIGSQVWTVKNLKTTKLNDGTPIPQVGSGTDWSTMSTPAYCWFNNNDSLYKITYGGLYNWYTVNTGKLCPKGWRVPTDADWTQLTDLLKGESAAGGKLKETGTLHWNSPNTAATNETGFTALPGGLRLTKGKFEFLGLYSIWWSSTSNTSRNAWCRLLNYENSLVYRFDDDKRTGLSVRCVRDFEP
jgi:uncharacterized protein (TIGR02145 family)